MVRQNVALVDSKAPNNSLSLPYVAVRALNPSEFGLVASMEQSLQYDAWSEQTLCEMYEQKEQTGFGVIGAYSRACGLFDAVSDEQLVGYLVYQSLDVSELLRLGVDRVYQGRKVAWQLMMAWLKAVKTTTAMLEVRADNESALKLYVKAGFCSIHTRKGYYKTKQGAVDAVVMERVIVSTPT